MKKGGTVRRPLAAPAPVSTAAGSRQPVARNAPMQTLLFHTIIADRHPG